MGQIWPILIGSVAKFLYTTRLSARTLSGYRKQDISFKVCCVPCESLLITLSLVPRSHLTPSQENESGDSRGLILLS